MDIIELLVLLIIILTCPWWLSALCLLAASLD